MSKGTTEPRLPLQALVPRILLSRRPRSSQHARVTVTVAELRHWHFASQKNASCEPHQPRFRRRANAIITSTRVVYSCVRWEGSTSKQRCAVRSFQRARVSKREVRVCRVGPNGRPLHNLACTRTHALFGRMAVAFGCDGHGRF